MFFQRRQTDIQVNSTSKYIGLGMREGAHAKLWFSHVQFEVQFYLVSLVDLVGRKMSMLWLDIDWLVVDVDWLVVDIDWLVVLIGCYLALG